MGGRRGERVFFTGMAAVTAGIVFAGFAPTFFLRPMFVPEPLPVLFVAHGVVFSCWIALLLVQTSLVAGRRTDLHMRLGVAGMAMAALMTVLGPMVTIEAARREVLHGNVGALAFLAVPLFDILVFALLVGIGFALRRRSDWHKRLMLLATLSITPAAIARLRVAFIQEHDFMGFWVADAIVVACAAYDTIARRRLHPAWIWGGLLVIASHPLRVALSGTDAWRAFARWAVAA
jgi:hypothetical protein